MERDKIIFKVDNEIIIEENIDLTIEQVNNIKIYICKEIGCFIDEIEVVFEKCTNKDLSLIDITPYGMVFYDEFPASILGVTLDLVLGSDEHLDAISNGTLENYLNFFM